MVETFDFIIVGAGIAGLSTAIQLQKYGGKTLVLMKRDFEDSSTHFAAGGIASSGPWTPNPDLENHVNDTLKAGDGLCREEVVRKILALGPKRIQELIEWNVKFDTLQDGTYALAREGGHSVRRILHSSDLTGKEIHNKLLIKAQSFPNIEFRTFHMAINLIEHKGECVGVYVLDILNDTIYAAQANATILATGGIGKVYLYTSNPDVASGDGIALAWRIGAEITNMEMVQFHPTCLFHPLA